MKKILLLVFFLISCADFSGRPIPLGIKIEEFRSLVEKNGANLEEGYEKLTGSDFLIHKYKLFGYEGWMLAEFNTNSILKGISWHKENGTLEEFKTITENFSKAFHLKKISIVKDSESDFREVDSAGQHHYVMHKTNEEFFYARWYAENYQPVGDYGINMAYVEFHPNRSTPNLKHAINVSYEKIERNNKPVDTVALKKDVEKLTNDLQIVAIQNLMAKTKKLQEQAPKSSPEYRQLQGMYDTLGIKLHLLDSLKTKEK